MEQSADLQRAQMVEALLFLEKLMDSAPERVQTPALKLEQEHSLALELELELAQVTVLVAY